jgi:hypothetical protein
MCDNGEYVDEMHFLPGDPFLGPPIMAIKDLNLDGVPELIIEGGVMSAGVMSYYIFEWTGTEFSTLTGSEQQLSSWVLTSVGRGVTWYEFWNIYAPHEGSIEGTGSSAAIADTDGNGTLELIVNNDIPIPNRRYDGPWRRTSETYKWNGIFFALNQINIDPPIYRFQAVEDGDRLSLIGNYQGALDLYEAAISSDKLTAWSLANYQAQQDAVGEGLATPTLIPFDQAEFDNLAAYSYYRIMLVDSLLNDNGAAQSAYDTLQARYPIDKQGHIYAGLATVFWQEYQSPQSIADACADAIQYAEEYKDSIFEYLGNLQNFANTHGSQSHYYVTWDVCPFK